MFPVPTSVPAFQRSMVVSNSACHSWEKHALPKIVLGPLFCSERASLRIPKWKRTMGPNENFNHRVERQEYATCMFFGRVPVNEGLAVFAWLKDIYKFLVRGVMPDHVRVRRQEEGPCRARLAFIVTFLMAVLHLCSPCFSLSKNVSKSCQAAALGPAPNQEDLKKLDRALPTYMLKTTGWDEQMAMKRWTETLKWRCEIDDDKVVQRPNPDFFRIHPHYPTYLHLEDRGGRLTYWEILGEMDPDALAREGAHNSYHNPELYLANAVYLGRLVEAKRHCRRNNHSRHGRFSFLKADLRHDSDVFTHFCHNTTAFSGKGTHCYSHQRTCMVGQNL